jgi:uncharacterized membrane protein required for colicin V production
MNGADLVVLLGLSFFAVRGYRGGLVHEALTVAAAVAGLAVALRWTDPVVARVAEAIPGPPGLATSLAFLFLFSVAFVLGRKIELMVRRTWVEAGRSSSNRLAGLSFGLIEGAVVVGLAVMGLQRFAPAGTAYDPEDRSMEGRVAAMHRQVEESHLARGMADLTGGMFSALMGSAEERAGMLASGGGDGTADGR